MSEELRDLSSPTFEHTRLRDAHFSWIDLAGAWVRHAGVRGVRMRGVELADVQIDGELENVVINGVDIGPLVEAEMVRQDPDYAKMKPQSAAEFREAWDTLERRWAATVERARSLEPALLHERVEDEWSFIETLRHLCYATDAWINRVYLGNADPWSPSTCRSTPSGTCSGPTTRTSAPTLDEVLALRADRQATVRRVFVALTDADLDGHTAPVEGNGWPPPDSYPVAEALSIVVNEEWHHRRFAERDLAVLEARG
jgi:uncharacterized damage-inducible protein DinB